VKNKGMVRYSGFLFSATAARVAGILISSLTFPYLVRVLGVQTYGLWSYVAALNAFLAILADPGITTHLTRQVAARRLDAAELLADYFVLRLCGMLIGAGLVLGLAHWEPRADVARLLRVYGIGLFIVNLASADQFLTALELFHARSLLMVGQQALYAVIVFLAVRNPADVLWIPAAILSTSLLAGLVGWAVLFRQGFRIPFQIQPARWKHIIVPSLHYAGSSLMSSLYHRAGHVLVRWLLGNYELGLYAAAVRLVDLMRGFVTTIVYVLTPRLAFDSHSLPSLKRTSRLVVAAMAATSIPMALGLVVTANRLVPWVLGASYLPAVPLVKWMAPYLVAASAASLWAGTILYALGRHRAYFAATAAGAAGGVLLYLLLIPAFGLAGAGAAFVLAELAVALIAFGLLPEPLRDLWKNPVIGISLAAAVLMAAAVELGTMCSLRLPLLVTGGALVYAVACGWYVRKWFHEQLGAA
jgi:PST family polysaccharide transporter